MRQKGCELDERGLISRSHLRQYKSPALGTVLIRVLSNTAEETSIQHKY